MQAWTAEDRTYAIATALASLVVALLVASNFGLVGSPLTRFAETPPVSVGAGPDVPAAPAPQPVPSQPVQL
ncbi:MAG TPA: hypothetical protein VM840_04740, partial [Actinomycetota bacterium]|nr:hypothetical protein [Actinomycetota bacterium]